MIWGGWTFGTNLTLIICVAAAIICSVYEGRDRGNNKGK